MPLNQSDSLVAEDRRREVAVLRRRRLTLKQIAAALAKTGRVNPRTGKPWSHVTIKNDVDYLTEVARAEAVRDVSEHKAEILADYHELLRLAWLEKRYEDVRKVLKDVRDLLGTDAPQVIIFEQVQERMTEALAALETEFADDPTTLSRAVNALMGASDHVPAGVN